MIGRSDGRSHMTIFSGPTGPKILLTQNQVIMPYPVPQNDSLRDRSAPDYGPMWAIVLSPLGTTPSLLHNATPALIANRGKMASPQAKTEGEIV